MINKIFEIIQQKKRNNLRMNFITIFLILFNIFSINNANKMMGRESLLKIIFKDYNLLNRPSSEDDQTYVLTELKLLQIDLVAKYQELVIYYNQLEILNY